MKKAELLDAAKAAVADRGLNYGTPEDNFRRIAYLWNAHLDNRHPGELSPADVAMMMVLMKIARLQNTPDHIDSWVDLAGYAACGAELHHKEEPMSAAPFALRPSDGPPRLIRFEPLPYVGLLSSLDTSTNVLSVDPELYNQLDNVDREILIRTLHRWTTVDRYLKLVPHPDDPASTLPKKEA